MFCGGERNFVGQQLLCEVLDHGRRRSSGMAVDFQEKANPSGAPAVSVCHFHAFVNKSNEAKKVPKSQSAE